MSFINQIFGIPLGWVMWLCYKITSNYGVSLIFFTVIIQMLMLPITLMSKKSMAQQSALQPYTQRLQQQYGNNREKMAEEQQSLYNDTGVSMMSGCLMPLIQFPILFGLMDVIYRPLTHITRISSDLIKRGIEIANTLGTTLRVGQEQLFLVPAVKANPSAFAELGTDTIDKITKFDMTMFGLEMSLVPDGIFTKLGIFIIISALLSLIQILVTQYISKKSQPEGTPAMGAGMNITMILMGPVMSLFIGLSFPVGLTIYWSIRYLVTIIQEVVIDIISPQKKIVEKYTKEFDEKIKNKNKKSKKPRTIKVESTDGEIKEETISQKQYESKKLAEARKRMEERYSVSQENISEEESETTADDLKKEESEEK